MRKTLERLIWKYLMLIASLYVLYGIFLYFFQSENLYPFYENIGTDIEMLFVHSGNNQAVLGYCMMALGWNIAIMFWLGIEVISISLKTFGEENDDEEDGPFTKAYRKIKRWIDGKEGTKHAAYDRGNG